MPGNTLCFAVHNHQPVGNFDSVMGEAFEKAYLPFLRLVKKFPAFKLALHNSGILYEWAEKHKPEFFRGIEDLLDGKQLELLGGGFYEPILPAIPEEDRVSQILKMSDYLEKRFGQRPKGIWVAERVWEPSLPKTLSEAGIEYTMLDDTHFKYAGCDGPLTSGPLVTEEEGCGVCVFPILKELRYKIPFGSVEDVANLLFSQAESPKIWVYADDGEKFGIWPKTYEHCYTNGWLENFLEAVTSRPEALQSKFFSAAVARENLAGRVYLPTAAYEEMLEWALPPNLQEAYRAVKEQLQHLGEWEKAAVFLRGGFWRNFLVKYPEANQLHKKMLFISARLQKLKSKSKINRKKWKQAQNLLYKGQCNCPYWHGVFGGAYLTHLRAANYQALIGAQNLTYELEHPKPLVVVQETDFDADGRTEIVVETPTLFCVIHPHRGGCISELDFKPKHFNLQNTFSSYPEAYHKKFSQPEPSSSGAATIHARMEAKSGGLEKYLPSEGKRVYPNWSFYGRMGDSVCLEPHQAKVSKLRKGVVVFLKTDESGSCSIEKSVSFKLNQPLLGFECQLKNSSTEKQHWLWGTEFNLNFEAPNAPDRYFRINGQKPAQPALEGEEKVENVTTVEIVDEWHKLSACFRFERPIILERRPIFTVSLSEGGAEKTFQGSKLLFGLPADLKPGQSIRLKFSLELLSL